jgi:hypothetical protein
VYVSDYRFLRPGTRYAAGILSGNAHIESKLSFSSFKTGEAYGSRAANASSSAWEGVFSAMTNKQVEAIAVDVTRNSRKAKPASNHPKTSYRPRVHECLIDGTGDDKGQIGACS